MTGWNNKEAEAATKAVSNANWQGNNIVIDSRSLKQGDIFLALQGSNLDGHDFVKSSLEKGASAAIVSKELDLAPLLLVKDTREALVDLAIYRRDHYQNKKIAITGSSGKTTTKEQLLICFNAIGKAYASSGNFNNDLGLPISLANLDLGSDYAIFEMGMNHAGEIEFLAKLARPDIAIITNIAPAHLEFFSSVKEIANAKAEIFLGLKQDGTAIINIDCEYGPYLISLAKKAGINNIITYGSHEQADCRLLSYQEDNISALIMGKKIDYKIGTTGIHYAINSLACLGAVYASLGDVQKSADNLINFTALKGRGKQYLLEFNHKTIHLIDDSYNSNPGSLRASLKSLAKNKANRKIAILSDMKELGPDSKSLHLAFKEDIKEHNLLLISIGEMMNHLYEALDYNNKLAHYDNIEQAIGNIAKYIKDGDHILVKGSNSTGISKIVNLFTNNQNLQEAS